MARFNRGDRLATLERLKEQRKNHWGQRSSTDPMTPKQRGEPPDADDDILVRGGHFDAVAALTEPQRQELYDSLCEGVDSGLT